MRVPLILLLLLSLAPSAWAGHFTVSPVRVNLNAVARTGTLTLTNRSADDIHVQVQGFAWAQTPDGAVELTPTS